MGDPRHLLGRSAEDATAAWLVDGGWRVLAKRWRARGHGELDLICLDPRLTLVGIEVRARTSGRTGSAAESVDRRRIGRLRATLGAYLVLEGSYEHRGLRLDLVTAEPDVGAAAWRLRRYPAIGAW